MRIVIDGRVGSVHPSVSEGADGIGRDASEKGTGAEDIELKCSEHYRSKKVLKLVSTRKLRVLGLAGLARLVSASSAYSVLVPTLGSQVPPFPAFASCSAEPRVVTSAWFAG
jgi:hypothetical protein